MRRDFKNVGIRSSVIDEDPVRLNRSLLPIGIKTPLELVGGSTLFLAHYNILDQIEDNLRNLLLTNWGERIALYDFGANLRPLLTEYSNKENFDGEAMVRINTAVEKWMPFVSLEGFDSTPDYEDNIFLGKIKIIIAYNVQNMNTRENVIELDLFIS